MAVTSGGDMRGDGEAVTSERALSGRLVCRVVRCAWQFFTIGVAAAVPISLRLKSKWPLPVLASIGTVVDLSLGWMATSEQRAALKKSSDAPPSPSKPL